MAAQMNAIQKYVVSTILEEPLGWQNPTLISQNVADEVAKFKPTSTATASPLRPRSGPQRASPFSPMKLCRPLRSQPAAAEGASRDQVIWPSITIS